MYYVTRYHPASPRAMALLDIPMGDPFGGPAYGQKEKSGGLGKVIGIVAAVASVATGYGMVLAANGAMTLGSVAGGAMMAGGVLSGVGAVTGNKKLSKIGGTLSLAGGIGSLGNDLINGGVGALGETASEGLKKGMSSFSDSFSNVFGQGAQGASAGLKAGEGVAQNMSVMDSTGALADAGSAGAGAGGGASSVAESVSSSSIAAPSAASGQTIGLDGGASLLKGPTTSNIAGFDQSSSSLLGGGLSQGAQKATGTLGAGYGTTPSVLDGAAVGASASGGASGSGGLISNLWDKATSPQGMQLVGNMMNGMGQASANDEMLKLSARKLDAEIGQMNNNQAMIDRRIANLNDPVVLIDPYSPNAGAIRAAAQKAGKQVSEIGVNPNAKVQTPMSAYQKPQGAAA